MRKNMKIAVFLHKKHKKMFKKTKIYCIGKVYMPTFFVLAALISMLVANLIINNFISNITASLENFVQSFVSFFSW